MRLVVPNEEDLNKAQQALRDAVLGSRKGLGEEAPLVFGNMLQTWAMQRLI